MPYVVESPATNALGERQGTFRVYVATEARAKEIAGAHPERTYREIAFEAMPEKASENMKGLSNGTN